MDDAEKLPIEDTRTVAQIRADIEMRQVDIASAFRRLDGHVHRALDWRAHTSRHLLSVVGAAAGLGVATALLFLRRPRRSPFERAADAVVDTLEDFRTRVSDSMEDVAETLRGPRPRSRVATTANATVVAMAAKAAADFLKERAVAAAVDVMSRRRKERDRSRGAAMDRFP